MKILAVEDDLVSRKIICRNLVKLGHDVIEASNGLEAIFEMERAPVRLVVSDWIMPQMNGLELCRKIRNLLGVEYTYFILLTAQAANFENQQEAIEAGVDDFLCKPLRQHELSMRLHVAERILRYATQVRQLETFLPICGYCKKIRDDKNYWEKIENYIQSRTGTDFSHSVCPDCYREIILPEINQLKIAQSISTQTESNASKSNKTHVRRKN